MLIIRSNVLPDIVDLFCGCGGLAAGFQKEGFRIVAGMDISEEAIQTISYNMHWRFGEESPYECRDITVTDASEYQDRIGENGCMIIGGPPCQAYSLAGRAKLRSLGKHRENIHDKRGYLYQDYLRMAIDLNAQAVVMENVPESTNYGGKNIPETVCEILEENGYHAVWTFLNAADFGVPQKRERIFVLAVRKDLAGTIELPIPTHRAPDSYQSSAPGRIRSFMKYPHFQVPLEAGKELPEWNTVRNAIDDLPVLYTDPHQKYSLGRMTQKSSYRTEADCPFQNEMRTWYGKETRTVSGNIFRKTLRDFPIFARMQQGDNFQQAAEIADTLLKEAALEAGISEFSNPEEFEKLRKKIVPPYNRENFLYKWTKLTLDQPSHTLVAHLSVDTYSHIHPIEPRGISVREAARLQSFPDAFLFQTNMGDAYKQIGNAVPPLLSLAIAKAMKRTLLHKKTETGD